MNASIEYLLAHIQGSYKLDRRSALRLLYQSLSANIVCNEIIDQASHIIQAGNLSLSCGDCSKPVNYRNDFDYSADCGIYHCPQCGNVQYPMETPTELCDDTKHICMDCESRNMHKVKNLLKVRKD